LSNRELKVSEKALSKKAKENGRANRDEEMDFFAAYYKESFRGQSLWHSRKLNITLGESRRCWQTIKVLERYSSILTTSGRGQKSQKMSDLF
jgi:hypothetical protein